MSIVPIFLMAFLINAQVSRVYTNYELFKDGHVTGNYAYNINSSNTDNINVNIPDSNIKINFSRVNLLSDEFYIETSSGDVITDIDGVFYQGSIDGDSNSIATLSMYKDNVVLSYSNKNGNFEITGDKGKLYTINKIEEPQPFKCFTEENVEHTNTISETTNAGCRAIQIYFEADYKLYQDKGSSVTNATNYITSLFNQVALLYANEQIVVQISQIKIWNTPDPYIQYTSTGNVLNAFRSNVGQNFNGNLAHFLSTRPLGGGIAYIDVLCVKSYAFGVSAINTSYQNVPTYSWSVEVITHELGHNIGSWHTQSCNWPNGALDNCYYTEGGCPPGPAPINGGTIMSYCHLTGYGINFANGFGQVPGNYIRNKYNTSTCLTGTSSSPIGLQTTNITQNTATVQWLPVNGAISYTLQYKQSNQSNWIVLPLGLNTSYNISGLTPNTQYQWQVKTDCSVYTNVVVFQTLGDNNACNLSLTPAFTNITQTSAFVYWVPLTSATSYILQYKQDQSNNWIEYTGISNNTFQLNGLQSNTKYIVRVRPNCNSNFGIENFFVTLQNTGTCPPPTGLQTLNITKKSATFTWQHQSFETGYNFQFKFPESNNWITFGSTFGGTTVNIVGLQPNSTYQWRIRNQCSDWSITMTFTTLSQLPQSEIVITPNPTTGVIKVSNVEGTGEIFDITGRKILDVKIDGSDIDISTEPIGVYYLRLNGAVYKIVKI